jgi:hypothetical protein
VFGKSPESIILREESDGLCSNKLSLSESVSCGWTMPCLLLLSVSLMRLKIGRLGPADVDEEIWQQQQNEDKCLLTDNFQDGVDAALTSIVYGYGLKMTRMSNVSRMLA